MRIGRMIAALIPRESPSMHEYQNEFIQLALSRNALRFGETSHGVDADVFTEVDHLD